MGIQFEDKLVMHLGYRGPWDLYDMINEVMEVEVEEGEEGVEVMEEMVEIFEEGSDEPCQILLKRHPPSQYPPKGQWRILDLGCGSGLCGKVFQDFIISKIGAVDGSKIDTITKDVNGNKIKLNKDSIITENTDENNISEKINDYGLNVLKKARCQSGGIMVGVDISIKMVEITEKSGYYTAVARGDLEESLEIFEYIDNINSIDEIDNNDKKNEIDTMKLDLILVADTFIYVGGLSSVFKHVKKSLNKYGLFAFSIEDLDNSPMKTNKNHNMIDDKNQVNSIDLDNLVLSDGEPLGAVPGWGTQLLTSARFAHSNSYIETLAKMCGFLILNMKIVTLRTEDTIPLYGRLYVLQMI